MLQYRIQPTLLIAVLVACIGMPATAFGHAEEPATKTIFARDDGWVARANVGIITSQRPDELICEEAFLGGDGWLLAAFGLNEFVTFGATTVMRTDDGCDFETVLEIERKPSDVATHVTSGSVAFVMNGTETDGVWVSSDRGRTFERMTPFDVDVVHTTALRFVDENTLVVSGYDRDQAGLGLMYAVDLTTQTASALDVPNGVTYPYLLDAAPSGHLLLLGRAGDQIVFWGPTEDVGQNEFVASTWPSGARLSEDGQTAWVSGVLNGNSVAVGTLDAGGVAQWSSIAEDNTAGCVEPVGEDVYFCGLARFDEFDILSVDSGGEVRGVLDFRDFAGVRSDCPDDTEVGTVCPLAWEQLAPYFGIELPDDSDMEADSGTADAGVTDAGPPPVLPQNADDGCCATVPTAGEFPAILILVALVLWRDRRPSYAA